MKLFAPLLEKTLRWSRHPNAPWFLVLLSFVEAIFFPVPPEAMLAPMSLADRRRALRFATLSLAGSMVGMFVGYAIGHFAIDLALPWIERFGYAGQFKAIEQQAAENGFWLLLLAGFTPVPFKIFTIASGAVGMPLLPFFFGALIGRGKRVYLVAGAIRIGGARAEMALQRYVEPIGWIATVAMLAVVAWLVLRHGGAA